jgi:hypothetical protein
LKEEEVQWNYIHFILIFFLLGAGVIAVFAKVFAGTGNIYAIGGSGANGAATSGSGGGKKKII